MRGVGSRRRGEEGTVIAFVAVVVAALMILVGLDGDGGAALSAEVRALHESEEAARMGARALDVAAFHKTGARVIDPDAARAAVARYLATTRDTGIVVATPDSVHVKVTARHNTWLLGMVGIRSIAMDADATAHPETTVPQNPYTAGRP
jgi:hypothetical protein